LEHLGMGSRVVLASVLLFIAAVWLSAEAQYFRGDPFAGRLRIAPYGSPSVSPYAYPGYRPDVSVPSAVTTYRTLCVRLCDGFYFPISFAVPESGFDRDAEQCRASCGSAARLFYHANPGGSVERMFDLSGRAYNALPTAFAYRKALVAGCSCRPQPSTAATASTSESVANIPTLAPRAAARNEEGVGNDAGRALLRPEPIERNLALPGWAAWGRD
jgi:hypothetical protein